MKGTSFRVQGSAQLSGQITPQGAKNEALQILSAVLLTDQKVTIHNIPDILDVQQLIKLLKGLGVKVDRLDKSTYTFQSDNIDLEYFSSKEYLNAAKKIRGSVMLMGPLMVYEEKDDTFFLDGNNLKGTFILMDEISVTGTANLVMAASLVAGTTTIYNAACEPYLQQLCKMLVSMGAQIEGIGSNMLKITGVSSLKGCSHTILPDFIEVGSFIGLAAMTQSPLTITGVLPEHLGIIPSVFEKLGVEIEFKNGNIEVPAQEIYEIQSFIDGSIMTIYDAPWPGFTPDLLSIILVMATQAKGSVLIHQKMFESRLFFVDKLIDMGAQVILCDPHRATVIGLGRSQQLKAIEMTSPDIRAGVSLLIAALSAKGTSTIHNVNQIDRGYQDIEERLNALGAQIERF